MNGFKNQVRNLGVKCPNCHSVKMVKSGSAMSAKWKLKQRYHCLKCGVFTVNVKHI
jgi:transposase-like protein